MASRSLNRVQLIGNLTRDPELRYTPQGTAVCSFGVATNRSWQTDSGDRQERAEFHRIVAWNRLAEICAQFLSTGRKVYIEGRLQTRKWQTQEGQPRQTTEIVANEMIILDRRGDDQGDTDSDDSGEEFADQKKGVKEKKESSKEAEKKPTEKKGDTKSSVKSAKKSVDENEEEEINADDIPF
jgi:single-strand DNA-binding protein